MLMYLDLIIDYGCIGQCPSDQDINAELFGSEAGFLSAFNKVIGGDGDILISSQSVRSSGNNLGFQLPSEMDKVWRCGAILYD